jgi:hypothetical protein
MNFSAMLMAAALDVATGGAPASLRNPNCFSSGNSHGEAKAIIIILLIFSIFAWSVMAAKALQMRRAKRMNAFFDPNFARKTCFAHFRSRDPSGRLPNFAVYQADVMNSKDA